MVYGGYHGLSCAWISPSLTLVLPSLILYKHISRALTLSFHVPCLSSPICVCVPSVCARAGMRQPSQLEGYLGTCVLHDSPRANTLGTSRGSAWPSVGTHTHKHTQTHTQYTMPPCSRLDPPPKSPHRWLLIACGDTFNLNIDEERLLAMHVHKCQWWQRENWENASLKSW